MEATGVISVGESTAALAYIKTRRGLSPRQIKMILVLCILVVAIPIGAWLSGSWLAAALSAEFAIVGLVLGSLIVQRLIGLSMRKALAERGIAYDLPVTLRITPDALIYDLGDLKFTARWSCVTDLYQTRKYWVFLVQSSSLVLPRHFFDSAEEERNFITEVIARMTDPARARSPDGTKVAGDP